MVKDSLPIKIKEKLEQKYNGYSFFIIAKDTVAVNAPIYKLQARKEKLGDGKSTVTIYDLTFNTEGKLLSESKRKEVYYTGAPSPKKPASHSKGDGHNH